MPDEHCIFCRMVAGDVHCHRLYEDEHCLAFLDHSPASPGHTLIITKRHYDDLFTAEASDVARVAALSVPLAGAIDRALGCAGLRVQQLNRAAAGQSVFHYHMHLIPQQTVAGGAVHGRHRAAGQALARIAEQIRAEMGEF